MQWTYLPEGGRPTRVRVSMAARCLHVASGRVGAVVRVGEGEHPDGPGTCEAYWLRGEAEVPADTAGATRLLRGGTGDVQLRYAGSPVGNIYRGVRGGRGAPRHVRRARGGAGRRGGRHTRC